MTGLILLVNLLTVVTPVPAEEAIEVQGEVISREGSVFVETKVERTVNKEADSMTDFVSRHLLKLVRTDDDLVLFRFKSAYPFSIDTENGTSKDFVLKVGQGFKHIDDHGSNKLRLLEITDEAIRLGYTSEFHYHSFGNNLTTIDEGEIVIRYRD